PPGPSRQTGDTATPGGWPMPPEIVINTPTGSAPISAVEPGLSRDFRSAWRLVGEVITYDLAALKGARKDEVIRLRYEKQAAGFAVNGIQLACNGALGLLNGLARTAERKGPSASFSF